MPNAALNASASGDTPDDGVSRIDFIAKESHGADTHKTTPTKCGADAPPTPSLTASHF